MWWKLRRENGIYLLFILNKILQSTEEGGSLHLRYHLPNTECCQCSPRAIVKPDQHLGVGGAEHKAPELRKDGRFFTLQLYANISSTHILLLSRLELYCLGRNFLLNLYIAKK
jgi:hypothetical protein